MVRVPEPEPYTVCEVLDAGANGVVAPHMETTKQVKDLIGATKVTDHPPMPVAGRCCCWDSPGGREG